MLVVIGLGVLFILTARDFTPTEEQKEAVVTANYAAEWFEIEPQERAETWECKRYLDGSKDIYYLYYHDSITLDCTLTIERKRSDALATYAIEWQGLKLGNRLGESNINLEVDDTVFKWGDASKFAYQSTDGERHGFAFITRKDSKIFFIDAWGLVFDAPSDFAEFLTPKLEHYERTSF